MSRYVLAIDQGTTSTRAILFEGSGKPCAVAQKELPQIFPKQGWVEHDLEEIWSATVDCCRQVLAERGADAAEVAAIGITNQRETTALWDRRTGTPLHNAIVWQDRRTADHCELLRSAGALPLIQEKTGLLLDPYFSGTKLAWLLEQVPGARTAAERGDVAFGTIDCFLLWRLTGGRSHATDASNASRTLLFNLATQEWDPELLKLLGIPASVLPDVRDNAADYGTTDADLFGAPIPITGMVGDQQGATFGQACFEPGMMKSTYGTGCFVLLNTGSDIVHSKNRLLTTVAWRLDGETTYALEGSVFSAGSTIQWLRDGLQLFEDAGASEAMARQADPEHRVYLVPAFTGLGAPYWDPHARGAILGITRDTGVNDLARAGLESVSYQTRDLLGAMEADGAGRPSALRVDGGMVRNDWAMQFLADILPTEVERSRVAETTALGAAYLAGLHTGFYPSLSALTELWQSDRSYSPAMTADERESRYAGWQEAVSRVRSRD